MGKPPDDVVWFTVGRPIRFDAHDNLLPDDAPEPVSTGAPLYVSHVDRDTGTITVSERRPTRRRRRK